MYDTIEDVGQCMCGKGRSGYIPDPNTPRRIKYNEQAKMNTDSGWWVCSKCLKPTIQSLNQCDVCEKPFKGIRPGIKFAYTCPSCEAKL